MTHHRITRKGMVDRSDAISADDVVEMCFDAMLAMGYAAKCVAEAMCEVGEQRLPKEDRDGS